MSGRVIWVDPAFQSGGRFEAGQTLFRIDEANYVYRLREAEATLADRQVAYLEAQEEAVIARAEYERFASQQPDSAAPLEASPLASREPQLAAARAALERDEAAVAEANRAVARTRVTAPFNGYVRDESVDVGRFVATGQSVARLFSADAVEVVVPLSDANAALIPGLWTLRIGDGDGAGEDGEGGAHIAARAIAEYGDTRYAWDGFVDRAEASLGRGRPGPST